ncbi:MAG: RiPP maturation radical SAM protein 1 [bacterium]|nr:RiPP maturation radical SAM protein 1 [bacterium]
MYEKETMDMNIKRFVLSVLGKGDILLIVPPFVTSRTPVMGPHILQAVAGEHGFTVEVLHLNLLTASIMGVNKYESICFGQPYRMLGERLFARSAYGLPPLGKKPELCSDPVKSVFGDETHYTLEAFEYKYYASEDFEKDTLPELEKTCYSLIEEVAPAIASLEYKMVGCSSNWEQNNCSIALLNRIKQLNPGVLTLMGGSNCEGEMAEGIGSLSESIDYIFSGESEETFAGFLESCAHGDLPSQRIIVGEPVKEMDAIPFPDYGAYFEQVDCFFREEPPQGIVICCETSRGCWYGKCTFCGLNGKRGRYRHKSATRARTELEGINSRYPEQRIIFIDKVMPGTYTEQLLPRLREQKTELNLAYELRPDIEPRELITLKEAGIHFIKPGIEALSTGILDLMNKGVTASQNIRLLKTARTLGIWVSWNLLWGIPGDRAEDYEETLRLLPLIRHFNPPDVFRHISLDRFSPYFEKPGRYNIENLRPWAAYNNVYPDWAVTRKTGYRFTGDYSCGAYEKPGLIREIAEMVQQWRKSWKGTHLTLIPNAGYYILFDSRETEIPKKQKIEPRQAKVLTMEGPYTGDDLQKWAVEEKLAVVVDTQYIPLVTTSPGLLSQEDA